MNEEEIKELKILEDHYDNNRSVYEELGTQGAESYIEYYRNHFPDNYERLHTLTEKQERCT